MAEQNVTPFVEVGSTGLIRYGGWVSEEWFRDLQGTKGIKVYKEMRDKEAIALSNSYGSIKQGTRIEGVKTIASGKDIREVGRLVNTYPLQNGGKTNKTDWHKKRGTAIILHKDTGAEHIREVHWYECKNIGKVEFKVKIPKMGDAE